MDKEGFIVLIHTSSFQIFFIQLYTIFTIASKRKSLASKALTYNYISNKMKKKREGKRNQILTCKKACLTEGAV